MYREQMELWWFRFKDWVNTLVMKRFKPNKPREVENEIAFTQGL